MEAIAQKYDRLAEGFSAAEYAAPRLYMQRRARLLLRWGTRLRAGDRVVEIGCGDGMMAETLVAAGLRYRGIDIAPGMVDVTSRRLVLLGVDPDVEIADVNAFRLDEPCDALVSYRTFFSYVEHPEAVLAALRPMIRKKLVIDFCPRRDIPLAEALAVARRAGFRSVAWRPFFVPMKRRVAPWVLRAATVGERIPGLRALPLRWKFHVVLRAEP